MKLDLRTAELAHRHFGGVAARLWRLLRALFHEVMAVLFLALAGWGALWLVRAWRTFDGEADDVFRMALVGAFVLMMGGFGVSSFWRARRIARGK